MIVFLSSLVRCRRSRRPRGFRFNRALPVHSGELEDPAGHPVRGAQDDLSGAAGQFAAGPDDHPDTQAVKKPGIGQVHHHPGRTAPDRLNQGPPQQRRRGHIHLTAHPHVAAHPLKR
ncbi:MAG TPA: hypothetical protein VGL49_01500, partial [Acidimicrobiales bacterium]